MIRFTLLFFTILSSSVFIHAQEGENKVFQASMDEDPAVASHAAEALCYLGMEGEAIPALMKLVEECQPDVFSSILTLIYEKKCMAEFKANLASFDKAMELVESDAYSIYRVPGDIYYVAKIYQVFAW